jgi:hypothetical protein
MSMDSMRRHGGALRRATTIVAACAAAAIALVIVAPAGARQDQPAAKAPDCQHQPDSCKTASVGQDLRRRATAARKGRSRCQAWTVERWGKSAVGIKLWSYYLDVHWCYRRGRITEADADPRPSTHGVPGWAFDKHLAFRTAGGRRKSFYRVFAQGKFTFCITKLGCIQDAQPWIRFTARGDGSHSYATGA